MRHAKSIVALALLLGGAIVALSAGCASSDAKPGDARPGKAAVAPESSARKLGAAQIWADNCRRCHNVRSPSVYSQSEWEVAVHHMRVRGNLTGEEERTITEFLKASR